MAFEPRVKLAKRVPLKVFLGSLVEREVTVIVEGARIHGKLVHYDSSHHGDFGCLVLQSQHGPVLIVRWIAICR